FLRSAAATALAIFLVFAPVTPTLAQNQAPQNPPPAPAQGQAPNATQAQPFHIAEGTDYTQPTPFFPHVLLPYKPRHIDLPQFVNSPHIMDLVQNGQLRITVEDAVELALENNLDISVQRYNSLLWETDYLRAKGGAVARGVAATGTALPFATLPL